MRRGFVIALVLAALAGCGGPDGDRANVGGASLQLDRPSGKQFDGGLQGAGQSPAQELFLLLVGQDVDTAGSSPDPLPGIVWPVGSSPDPLPGLCNDEGDCLPPRGR